jgi:hypothetical protein
MKTAAISGAVIAALAVGALATPSFAQPYRAYDNTCRSDGTAGTVIGGIAGALLGSNLAAHHGGRAGGAAIGGVAGALLGNSIARGNDNCRTYSEAYRAPVYQAPAYGYGYGDRSAYGYATRYERPVYRAPVYERRAYDHAYDHDRRDYRYGY